MKNNNKLAILIVTFILLITIATSQIVTAQQSPIIGTTSDTRMRIQIYSFSTSTTIPYYPNTPSQNGYVWAMVDMSITNLQTTATISTNTLYAHIKDSQNHDYTSATTLDPQELKLAQMPAGQTQRGNIYWEIPVGASITNFYWYDYTSNVVLPSPSPTPTASPTPSPTPTITPTTAPTATTSQTTAPTQTTINPTPTTQITVAPTTAPTDSPTPKPTVPEFPTIGLIAIALVIASASALVIKKQHK